VCVRVFHEKESKRESKRENKRENKRGRERGSKKESKRESARARARERAVLENNVHNGVQLWAKMNETKESLFSIVVITIDVTITHAHWQLHTAPCSLMCARH